MQVDAPAPGAVEMCQHSQRTDLMPAAGNFLHAVLQGLKGGPVLWIAKPALLHESGQRRRAVGGDRGPESLLDNPDGCLQWGHVSVGDSAREQLPEDDGKGEHVRLVVVGAVLDDLRCHPPAKPSCTMKFGSTAKVLAKCKRSSTTVSQSEPLRMVMHACT